MQGLDFFSAFTKDSLSTPMKDSKAHTMLCSLTSWVKTKKQEVNNCRKCKTNKQVVNYSWQESIAQLEDSRCLADPPYDPSKFQTVHMIPLESHGTKPTHPGSLGHRPSSFAPTEWNQPLDQGGQFFSLILKLLKLWAMDQGDWPHFLSLGPSWVDLSISPMSHDLWGPKWALSAGVYRKTMYTRCTRILPFNKIITNNFC